jgi:hypothetical protein
MKNIKRVLESVIDLEEHSDTHISDPKTGEILDGPLKSCLLCCALEAQDELKVLTGHLNYYKKNLRKLT